VTSVDFIQYKRNLNHKSNDNQKNFLICELCYWCASSVSISINHMIKSEKISKCPLFDDYKIRVTPILRGPPV
jgi:hypothetical protein